MATLGMVYQAVQPVANSIRWAATTEHEVAHLFLGKVVHDPGWLFYPFMLSIRSAALTLPLFLIGGVLVWRLRKQPQYALLYRLSISLALFVLLFTLCLSLAAKKFDRYLLPAFLVMDILAAVGLSLLAEEFFRWSGFRHVFSKYTWASKVLGSLAIGLVLLVQGVPTLALHPYYGTYY